MKTWKLLMILVAFGACKGSNDNELTATSKSNGVLKFDGKSAYKLEYGDQVKDDLVLRFIQQDEVRPMELKQLSDSSPTDLTDTNYFPRFIVQVKSGGVVCNSGPIPFSDAMQLECSDSSKTGGEETTEGGTNSQTQNGSNTLGSCSSGNSPATLAGAKFDLDRKDGELRLVFVNALADDKIPRMRSPWQKFDSSVTIFSESFVANGSLKFGDLVVRKMSADYQVFFIEEDTDTEYPVGNFTTNKDKVSGDGSDSIYRVNLKSNVCLATYKNGSGSLSAGNGYLVIGK
jgi:hypothetical protein